MGKLLKELTKTQIEFIENQNIFFVATAAKDGFVNVSPKGLDTLKVVSKNSLLWLNMTGSGNETAAHLLDTNRITIMFCSFDSKPLIIRIYGRANAFHPRDECWDSMLSQFPNNPSARQIFEVQIETTQSSCGYGVPLFDFKANRQDFDGWVEKKGGKDGLKKYWNEKNSMSINGKPTDI
ncbi:MAG: pyridoxamine 5'-phosphate oxidase family protein [Bacteroidia bacterium]